MRTWKHVHCWI